MYLSYLPKFDYKFGNFSVQMSDIFKAVKFSQKTLNDITGFDFFVIQDGENPDDIASRFYGDPNLYWLVLLSNDIIDPQTEWPRSTQYVDDLLTNTYDGFAFYFNQNMDIKEGDIIVKRDESATAGVSNQYGVVSRYVKQYRKAECRNTTFSSDIVYEGGFSCPNTVYVFRRKSNNNYEALTEGLGINDANHLRPIRIDTLADSVQYFEKEKVIYGPYTRLAGGPDTFDPTRTDYPQQGSETSLSTRALNTLIGRYMFTGNRFHRENGINIVTLRNVAEETSIGENGDRRVIKLIQKRFVRDIKTEVSKLLRGEIQSGVSKLEYGSILSSTYGG
tara:strand:- start:890 stop:1891 length:1002 start_codon:yes stop_codon:yes gene_type:complete